MTAGFHPMRPTGNLVSVIVRFIPPSHPDSQIYTLFAHYQGIVWLFQSPNAHMQPQTLFFGGLVPHLEPGNLKQKLHAYGPALWKIKLKTGLFLNPENLYTKTAEKEKTLTIK